MARRDTERAKAKKLLIKTRRELAELEGQRDALVANTARLDELIDVTMTLEAKGQRRPGGHTTLQGAPVIRVPRDVAELRTWMLEQWSASGPLSDLSSRSNYWIDAADHRAGLKQATLWHVSAEMCDLLDATIGAVPPDVTIADVHPPSYAGLVVLEKPWISVDAESGADIPIDAVMWHGGTVVTNGERHTAVSIVAYRHVNWDQVGSDGFQPPRFSDDDAQEYARDFYSRNGVVLHGEAWLPLGRSDWCHEEQLDEVLVTRQQLQIDNANVDFEGARKRSMVEDRQFLTAFWMLIREKAVTRPTVEYAGRPSRKRAERAGINPTVSSGVNVVVLRKLERKEYDKDPDAPPGRRMTYRILVPPHFRWQACGKNWTERKLIVVAPHIRGPEDGPLVIKQRVNAWRR